MQMTPASDQALAGIRRWSPSSNTSCVSLNRIFHAPQFYSADERCEILSARLSDSGDPSDVVRVDCTWSEICYEYILGE